MYINSRRFLVFAGDVLWELTGAALPFGVSNLGPLARSLGNLSAT